MIIQADTEERPPEKKAPKKDKKKKSAEEEEEAKRKAEEEAKAAAEKKKAEEEAAKQARKIRTQARLWAMVYPILFSWDWAEKKEKARLNALENMNDRIALAMDSCKAWLSKACEKGLNMVMLIGQFIKSKDYRKK